MVEKLKLKVLIKNEFDMISKLINKNQKKLIFVMDDLARIYYKIEEIEENNQITEKEKKININLIMMRELHSISDELELLEKYEYLNIYIFRHDYLSKLFYKIHINTNAYRNHIIEYMFIL